MIKRRSWLQHGMMYLLAGLFFLPFYYLIVNTFKTKWEAINHPWALPSEWIFDSYAVAFERMNYFTALFNTVAITVMTVSLLILLSSLAAFAFYLKRDSWVYRILFVYFLIGLFVPPQTNIVPLYQLIDMLGLVNTLSGVVLVNISGAGLAFDIFFYTIFMRAFQHELIEAARIDGASLLRTFYSVVFPLMLPATVTIAIFNIMGAWNEFLIPFIFLQTSDKWVLTTTLFTNFGQFQADWTIFMAMIVLSLLPVLIIYLFLQRYIVDGIATGALKG